MNRSSISPDLLQKYLTGTATDTERRTVETWYGSLRGQSDYLQSLPETERQQLQAETYLAIQSRLRDFAPDTLKILPTKRTQPWFRQTWAAVSGLAATLILIAWISVKLIDTGLPPSHRLAVTPSPTFVRFINQQPRIVQQRLPDGTLVWLHPQAELRYPNQFAARRRDVQFAGEAFFEVTRDAKRPFRIQSGNLQIQVVGTSFNVRANPKQALFEVAVVTGKVLVRSLNKTSPLPAEPVMLLPKQEVLYNVLTAQLSRHQRPAQPRLELYEPISISFADMPLPKVLRQLESRFNIRIRVGNPALTNCHLTADFSDQSLPVILQLLCASLDATYTMAGETIMLNGEGCP
ncbi:DUF4974 domain-containing protein [Spirosoma sp. HMF3257]|uniref:Iron dicitrate transport regulator FecR n=1 Tax=Spirosoma telluris TaxID=2183553 RepID=A0A327NCX5_9BACT|nr:DUF4974 domain-containing protein [Spirosoma telluris]RAI73110.1 iron dicitrate transport regulator FecR [Spirosoma telluris]